MPWLDVILRVVMSVELMMSRWRIWYGGYLLENKRISDILEILYQRRVRVSTPLEKIGSSSLVVGSNLLLRATYEGNP